MAEGFVTARGKRATRRCERRPLPSTNLVSKLSLPRCLDTSTKGGFPVTISTYSTQHDGIPHWIQAMKTAYQSTNLGPHLIKLCLFVIQTFEKLRILTRLNSPWQSLTMGMPYRLNHHCHCTNFFFLFSLSVLTITELSQESKISVWSAFLHAWPQKMPLTKKEFVS